MRDSLMPSRGTGSNKVVVFLLVGGTIVMAIALFFVLKQRSETGAKKPIAELKQEEKASHVPTMNLVAPKPPPTEEVEDAGAKSPTEPASSKSKKKRRERQGPGGKIDAKQVNSFINARFSQVKACYERRLKVNSFLEGKLDLNIGILASGKVNAISVNRDTVRDTQMLACVKNTILGWQFPKPEGGRVVIAKTFNFKKKVK